MGLGYYLSGGLTFNRMLKKTPHKKEQEKQIKKDYSKFCFKLFFKNLIILLILFFLLWLLSKKIPGSALLGLLATIFCAIWYLMIANYSDERKYKRKVILSDICNKCQEYNNFTRAEKLVDVDHEIETETVNESVDIKSRNGHVIGTAEVPSVISKVVRKETYYVTKTCNCCGKVFYNYETRRKEK